MDYLKPSSIVDSGKQHQLLAEFLNGIIGNILIFEKQINAALDTIPLKEAFIITSIITIKPIIEFLSALGMKDEVIELFDKWDNVSDAEFVNYLIRIYNVSIEQINDKFAPNCIKLFERENVE